MAIVAKVIADGQLPLVKAVLYTVPASKVLFARFFRLFNAAGGLVTAQIWVKPGSVSRTIYYLVMASKQIDNVLDKDDALVLEAGDVIEGAGSSAASVDFVITGGLGDA